MEKKLCFLVMFVFILGLAACSDDKDDQSIAEKLEGTYTGTIDVYAVDSEGQQGAQMGEQLKDQHIYMTAICNVKLRLELKDFVFAGITIKSIVIDTRASTDGTNTITGSAAGIEVMPGIAASAQVTGAVVDKVANLVIYVEAPLAPNTDPIKMLVKFSGTK